MPGHNDGYFECLDDFLDEWKGYLREGERDNPPPCYVWACKEERWQGIDIENIIDGEMGDHHEDAIDSIKALDELYKFVFEWNDKQILSSHFQDIDGDGRRHRENFEKKAQAEARRVQVEGELARGLHIPDDASRTVGQACYAWLDHIEALVKAGKRERSTWESYKDHVTLHIKPWPLASILLTRLRPSDLATFAAAIELSLSRAMAVKVLGSLKMALGFARRRQWLATDPVEGVRVEAASGRDDGPVSIPDKSALVALVKAADDSDDKGFSAAAVRLLLYAGLRASELRGLPRAAITVTGAAPAIRVVQRADGYQQIGAPKTRQSRRAIPLGPATAQAIRVWLMACPKSELGLAFPTSTGTVQSPMTTSGIAPKRVQALMGHATLQMTMDTYGHLWHDAAADQVIVQTLEQQLTAK